MKKIFLILLGSIPLGIGVITNWLILTFQDMVLPSSLLSLVFLAFWAWIGYMSGSRFAKPATWSIVLINLPTFLALVLNLYQEIVLRSYFGNLFGMFTQFFFLPVIGISFRLTSWSSRMWPAYIVAFILMSLAYFGGYSLQKNRK